MAAGGAGQLFNHLFHAVGRLDRLLLPIALAAGAAAHANGSVRNWPTAQATIDVVNVVEQLGETRHGADTVG